MTETDEHYTKSQCHIYDLRVVCDAITGPDTSQAPAWADPWLSTCWGSLPFIGNGGRIFMGISNGGLLGIMTA